jgi:hypothetical protein
MPTARELLEQADALMRRNRAGSESIPVLTDTFAEALGEPDLRGPSTRERASVALRASPESPAVAANAADEDLALALERSLAESAAAEPPLLTDAVEEVAVDLVPLPGKPEDDEDAPWLGPDTVDPALHSITGPAPDSVVVVPTHRAAPPDEIDADEILEPSTRTFRAAGSEPTPAPLGSMPEEKPAAEAVDEERWRALSEHISMQVLQRLDLFVDAGLKAKLVAHLQPIVARAGNELVEAINEHVGQLVRSYVAEVIEREIAQLRQGQP